jgi:hypothetical protein
MGRGAGGTGPQGPQYPVLALRWRDRMTGVPEPDDDPLAGPSRRQVLRLGSALLSTVTVTSVAGCGLRFEQDPVTTPAPPTADELARARTAVDADRLLALVDDVRQLRPDLAILLGHVASQHEAHLAALRLPASPTTPRPRTTPTASPTTTGSALTRASALGVLASTERAAAEQVRRELPDVSGDLARLLAAIGASRDCHAVAMTDHEKPGAM